jgi:methionine sulfoxide reductase heme-binding subunit
VTGSASYTDPTQHVYWLASRGLGVVAMLLVSVSVGLGLALSGRLAMRPGGAARLKTLHEATALVGLLAIIGHGALLLGDSYLRPGVMGIAVPFATPVQPFYNGLGIAAGWLAAALGLSFYARRWIGVRRWRRLHRWTLLVWVLGMVHTLGSGTDAAAPWLLVLLGASAVPLLVIGGVRLVSPPATVGPLRDSPNRRRLAGTD